MVRGWKSEYEKKKRERAKLAEEKLLQQVDDTMDFHGNTMDFHGATIGRKEKNNIPPIIPLAGDKKSSSAKAEAEAPENEPSERPTTGRRTGQTVAKGRDGAGSARPTAQTLHSGDSRERPAPTKQKQNDNRKENDNERDGIRRIYPRARQMRRGAW